MPSGVHIVRMARVNVYLADDLAAEAKAAAVVAAVVAAKDELEGHG